MKKCWIIAFALFFHITLSLFSQSVEYSFNAKDGNIFYHTVEQGQNVYRISIMYHVSEEDIYKLNPSSRQFIRVGEVLRIPQRTTFPPADATMDNMFRFHTIQPGETIYGVSRMYNITEVELVNANMGLTPQTFAAGKNIRIPAVQSSVVPVTEIRKVMKEINYTVQRRETIYGLARRFNVTEKQIEQLNPESKKGLRAGMVIKIPVETEEIVTTIPGSNELDINTLLAFRSSFQRVDEVRIALLMPFVSSDRRVATQHVEFYEGILLAVESMQNAGVTVGLSVFDIGDAAQTTSRILQNEIPPNTHLIIGGTTNEQIELIADYALKKGIKYIVPYPATNTVRLTSTNASIFQVVAPSQYLHSYAAALGCSLFANCHIIFVNTNDQNQSEDKRPFVSVFKSELSQRNMAFQDITYNEQTFLDDINALLSRTKPNVIVPLSSSLQTLNKIRGPLRTLAESQPASQLTLFGYPEWQRHIDACLDDFFTLNVHFYAPFFANNLSPDVQQFTAKYRYWFNKNMIQQTPRYAMLGYDIGRFFIAATHTLGSNFENNVRQVNYNSLQYGLNFERISNWGGFINTNLYVVRFNRDFTITRTRR